MGIEKLDESFASHLSPYLPTLKLPYLPALPSRPRALPYLPRALPYPPAQHGTYRCEGQEQNGTRRFGHNGDEGIAGGCIPQLIWMHVAQGSNVGQFELSPVEH